MANQFFIKTTDTFPALRAKLINVDGDYNPVTNVSSVTINVIGRGKRLLQKPATVTDVPNAIVSYTFTNSDLLVLGKGTFKIEYVLVYVDESVSTYPNDGEEVQLVIN